MKEWPWSAQRTRSISGIGLKCAVVVLLAICLMGAGTATTASAAGANGAASETLVGISALATTPASNVSERAAAPSITGVNGNPWGYNFSCCRRIYYPASRFCYYFRCIANFWNGRGYVVVCRDGRYSKSGGIRGACSYHLGVWRTLLRP